MVNRVPKFEEIQTFNHDGSTYHVKDLSPEQLELLQIYVSIEDDIYQAKMQLTKVQHSLNSVSGMFKTALVGVPVYVSPEELSKHKPATEVETIVERKPRRVGTRTRE